MHNPHGMLKMETKFQAEGEILPFQDIQKVVTFSSHLSTRKILLNTYLTEFSIFKLMHKFGFGDNY